MEETNLLYLHIRKERRGSYNGRLHPIIRRQQSCREKGIELILFDVGSCDQKGKGGEATHSGIAAIPL